MFFVDPSAVVTPDYVSSYITPVARRQRAQSCANKPTPKVVVKVTEANIKYDTSKTSKQLQAMSKGAYSPYGPDVHTRMSGLTRSKITYASNIRLSGTTNRATSSVCLWYETIEIVVTSQPIVFIAKEHLKHNCRYKLTLEHEMKHVRVDRQIILEYGPSIRQSILREVKRIGVVGPKHLRIKEESEQAMMKSVQKAVQNVIERITDDRDRRQRNVDTKEEYDFLSQQCGGKF